MQQTKNAQQRSRVTFKKGATTESLPVCLNSSLCTQLPPDSHSFVVIEIR